MTRDRRGFNYALDGVRSVTRWKIDALTLELAERQGEADDQQRRVDALTGEFRTGRTQLLARREDRATLDIGAERGAHAYLVRLQQAIAAATAELRTLHERCDETRAALLEARRFADSLERDRDAALAEHDLALARRLFADADDNWMQRQPRRNP